MRTIDRGPSPPASAPGRARVGAIEAAMCLLHLVVSVWPVFALEPSRRISQYAHTAWRMQDGAFGGAPFAIAQTSDGFIWIGTQRGLLRFDGVRFVPWLADDEGRTLPANDVLALWGGRDGSLWIGTSVAFARLKDGRLTTYEGQRARVNDILEDRDGTVWITRSRVADKMGPLCEIAGATPRCYGEAGGEALHYAIAPAHDRDGTLWFWSSHGLVRWTRGETRVYGVPALARTAQLSGAEALAADPDGAVWVGMTRRGPGLGLVRFEHGAWKPFATPDLDGSTLQVNALLFDRERVLWIGTTDRGLYRLRDGRVDHFATAEGLSGETVRNIFEDREGNVWVVTSDGIDCFRDTHVITTTLREGLSANWASSVAAGRDGTVWIGNHDALDALRPNGGIASIRQADGLPGVRVTSMLEDRAGCLWIGVDDGLWLYADGRFQPVTQDGKPTGLVVGLTEDRDQNIWAVVDGMTRRLLRIRDRTVVEAVPASRVSRVRSLTGAPDGGLWLGLAEGLARYRDGTLTMLAPGDRPGPIRDVIVHDDGWVYGAMPTGLAAWRNGDRHSLGVRNGLPCDSLYGVVADADRGLWLYAECGIIGVTAVELRRWHEAPSSRITVTTLDVFDGARPSDTPFRPIAARATDGRLWFANDTTVQMIDPKRLARKGLPPVVHLDTIIADRRRYTPRENLRIPPLTRDLEIDYTALSFVAPQKVRFRYRLDGRDLDWQNAGTRRQAFYTDLPPGSYRFRVIASNNDGVWNEAGATLAFTIAPAWFQTRWFFGLVTLSAVALLWIVYQLRVRQIAASIGARFEGRLAERTRIARDLHDTLLQTVQASKIIADEALRNAKDAKGSEDGKDASEPRDTRALEQLSEWLDQAVHEGRAALNSLRISSVNLTDLAEAFRAAAESIPAGRPAMTVSVSVQGPPQALHPAIREDVFRIGYEAMRNACAHSKGTQLSVAIECGQDLVVRVTDNGIGIAPMVSSEGKDGHFGLRGMRERAADIGATLKVLSSNTGTSVIVTVPGRVAFWHGAPPGGHPRLTVDTR
jgi:signal transduction histidine kinase/ligand-binding sensor domain-containing protein